MYLYIIVLIAAATKQMSNSRPKVLKSGKEPSSDSDSSDSNVLRICMSNDTTYTALSELDSIKQNSRIVVLIPA